jgi:integrase
MSLTLKKVRDLIRRGQPIKVLDGRNLYLIVRSRNAAHWELRYQIQQKKRHLGLGSAFDFNLLEARESARKARQQITNGNDPVALKRAERAQQAVERARSKTFDQVCDEYYDAHADKWSPKSRSDFMQKMKNHAHPTLGSVPVNMIDQALVLSALQPIWKTMTVSAGRIQRHIANVLNFAAAAGYRQGENCARWDGHLEHLLAAPTKLTQPQHHAALHYRDLPDYLVRLRAMQGIPARALEFLILNGNRTSEVIGAQWPEVEGSLWVIPAARMKNKREHRVPLSRQAQRLLAALPKVNDFIFPGTKPNQPISQDALNVANKLIRPDVQVHGFRTTLRVWIEERTSASVVVAEQSLSHKVGSSVEWIYRRTDLLEQRAALLQQWADYVESTPITGDVVTRLRA